MSNVILCEDNNSYDLGTFKGQRDYLAKFLRDNGANTTVFSCFEKATSTRDLKKVTAQLQGLVDFKGCQRSYVDEMYSTHRAVLEEIYENHPELKEGE